MSVEVRYRGPKRWILATIKSVPVWYMHMYVAAGRRGGGQASTLYLDSPSQCSLSSALELKNTPLPLASRELFFIRLAYFGVFFPNILHPGPYFSTGSVCHSPTGLHRRHYISSITPHRRSLHLENKTIPIATKPRPSSKTTFNFQYLNLSGASRLSLHNVHTRRRLI